MVLLRGRKNIMFWKLLRSVRGLAEDRLFCCLYAAFLNESINREIITGRNLEPEVNSVERVLE